MAKLKEIAGFLDKELSIRKIKDSSKNGLQVNACSEIKRIGFAVDAVISTFEKARKKNVDLLIAHHGIFWKKDKDEAGLAKKRADYCRKNKISVYTAHLPLDWHPKHGHNIILADMLNLKKIKRFGYYEGQLIGFAGNLDREKSIAEIAAILNRKLGTKCRSHVFGKKKIRTVAISSGGSCLSDLAEASKKKIDCLVTGDLAYDFYNDAKDLKLNIISAGHYATETIALKKIMPLLKEKFKIETVFIDNPTNI